MLQQFTWQDFLVAAVVFSLVWCSGLLLLMFRKNGKKEAAFTGAAKGDAPLPHRWENGVDQMEEAPSELMGMTKLPEGMDNVSMSGIAFVQDEKSREDQVGLVPDVLQEIKEVFAAIAAQDLGKRDFFVLMEQVSDRYPKISSSPNMAQINGFIAGHAPFHLSAEELENLWD